MDHSQVQINADRLWQRLMTMAKIGATPAGGCNRQALTDEDRRGRDLFCEWARAAGCSIEVDQMGNVFARRDGNDADAAPVMAGSHLDTQPTGGKYDGVFGVLAALEVIESLNDHGISTQHPVEAVVWTNEEGARFSPAMIGSGVFAGAFDLKDGLGVTDKSGLTLGDELKRIGYSGERICAPSPIHAAFEAHIEQGPILEAEGDTIGVVNGVQGMRWFDVTITGEPVHAGPTPMNRRRDPFRALHRMVAAIYGIAEQFGEDARATLGDIQAEPGARNTVPSRLVLAVDLRHPDESQLDAMEVEFRDAVQMAADAENVDAEVRVEWASPAVRFDAACIDAVRRSAQRLGLNHRDMVSGAGHDSVYLSRVAPTSMIFVPCKDGISHNEAESATPEDLAAGANVLLHAMLARAERSE